MKLSRSIKIALAGLACFLLILFGLLIYAAATPRKVAEQPKDPNVCEFCGSRSLTKAGECTNCIGSMGREGYLAKKASKNWYNSPAIANVVITFLCVLVLVFIIVNWHKYFRRQKEEIYYYIHCTKCGRKLRFRDTQVNHLGRCPLCHKPILFPKPPEESREGYSWRKIVRYVWG
jgi:DNA-directed RNA polymerase subunit RPC12/RpoP